MHSVLALKDRNSTLFGDGQWERGGVEFDTILSICFCILEKKPQGHFLTQKEQTCQISADSEQLGKSIRNSHLGPACTEPLNLERVHSLRMLTNPMIPPQFFVPSVIHSPSLHIWYHHPEYYSIRVDQIIAYEWLFLHWKWWWLNKLWSCLFKSDPEMSPYCASFSWQWLACKGDSDPSSCPTWASQGWCEKNPSYMSVHCSVSCQTCGESSMKEKMICDNGFRNSHVVWNV